MDPLQVAERLRRAELELRRSQDEHDGSDESTERYRAAVRELAIAMSVARAMLAEL